MSNEPKKEEPKPDEKKPEPTQPASTPNPTAEPNTIRVEHIIKTDDKKAEDRKLDANPTPAPVTPPVQPTPQAQPAQPSQSSQSNEVSKEDLQKLLDKRDAELAAIALKSFEAEKKKLLDVVPENKKAEVEAYISDDPTKLEQVKFFTNLQVKALNEGGISVEGAEKIAQPQAPAQPSGTPQPQVVQHPPASGVIPQRKPTSNAMDITGRKIIDELYALENDYTKSEAERQAAKIKINELFGSMVKGVRNTMRLPRIVVQECPYCHRVMEGSTCQHCGYTLTPYEQKSFGEITGR